MAFVSTSVTSQMSNHNSLMSTQFSGLRRSFSKFQTSVSTHSLFQQVNSQLRMVSPRRGSRGVVAMAGSGKV